MKNLLSDAIKSAPSSFIRNVMKTASDPSIISFGGGCPHPDSFPKEEIIESTKRVVETYGASAFQYSITAGIPELRQWIADRYNQKFGMHLTVDNVIITTGAQQGLDLITRVLINPGDGIAVEHPTYLAAIQAFALNQPKFYPVELSEDSLNLEQLQDALDHNIKLLYTIPDFQNPTGLTYTAGNRDKIYEMLKDREVVLVEDDPYGELRFDGERLPYIGAGRFQYSLLFGTFSKTVAPGMRTGFVISENTALLGYLTKAKEATDLHTNVFTQYLIYDYLTHNDYEAHIAKITQLYHAQAQAMMDAMAKYFPSNVKYTRPHGGMFLWVTLPDGVSAMELFPKALEQKIAYVPGDPFFIDVKDSNTMRLNFTGSDCETIEKGIHILGDLLKEL